MSYICETCGKEYKTRSGLWKHQKKFKHGKYSDSEKIVEGDGYSQTADDPSISSMRSDSKSKPADTVEPIHAKVRAINDDHSSGITSTNTLSAGEDTFSEDEWFNFDFGETDDKTDTIPTPLKMVVNQPIDAGGKMSKAQKEAFRSQNMAILKMGLTTTDLLLSKYGQAVSLDKDFKVEHSESDKDLVANAQYRFLEEKGLFLTNYLSSGIIAGSLTAWYVGSPLMRIRKKRKKSSMVGSLFSRLPLIGRFFKKKPKIEIAQNADDGVNDYVEIYNGSTDGIHSMILMVQISIL